MCDNTDVGGLSCASIVDVGVKASMIEYDYCFHQRLYKTASFFKSYEVYTDVC